MLAVSRFRSLTSTGTGWALFFITWVIRSIVDIGGINVRCHRISFCACGRKEVHQRNIRLVTIQLGRQPSAR